MAAPNKSERQKCWQARDMLWQCLDDHDDDRSKCKAQRKAFETNCIAQWVSICIVLYARCYLLWKFTEQRK